MNKKLEMIAYDASMQIGQPERTETYLRTEGVLDNGIIINDCISKRRANNKVGGSAGLLIKLKSNGKGFKFDSYVAGTVLGVGEFAVVVDVISKMFSDNTIKSLIVFRCNNDTIVIEMSKEGCSDGGGAGDGFKVKLP